MPRILIAFPTAWDRKRLGPSRPAWGDAFTPVWGEPSDEDCPWDFDVLGYIDGLAGGGVDGVFSSSDYPGAAAAAAIAGRLGLPGPRPEAVLTCSHKYYSRLVHQRVAPECTPPFILLDPAHPPERPAIGFPLFVKPVRASFSMLAERIDDREQLGSFLAQPAVAELTGSYLQLFYRLLERYTDFAVGGACFLGEGVLRGDQVTVEGLVTDGRVEILGIVDSVMYPGTRSFARFDYPSALPLAVQERMESLVRRLVPATGLDRTLWNVELTYDPEADRIGILEINPRICGQFADLYEKVDGVNSYRLAAALAVGERPRLPRRQGSFAVASSLALRTFRPVRVERVPGAADLAAVEALFPGTLVWLECRAGQELSDFSLIEDGASARYAVVNLGAADRAALLTRAAEVEARLGFRLAPL